LHVKNISDDQFEKFNILNPDIDYDSCWARNSYRTLPRDHKIITASPNNNVNNIPAISRRTRRAIGSSAASKKAAER